MMEVIEKSNLAVRSANEKVIAEKASLRDRPRLGTVFSGRRSTPLKRRDTNKTRLPGPDVVHTNPCPLKMSQHLQMRTFHLIPPTQGTCTKKKCWRHSPASYPSPVKEQPHATPVTPLHPCQCLLEC